LFFAIVHTLNYSPDRSQNEISQWGTTLRTGLYSLVEAGLTEEDIDLGGISSDGRSWYSDSVFVNKKHIGLVCYSCYPEVAAAS
jgi:hypothetical protein